jgi:hypothetical protein
MKDVIPLAKLATSIFTLTLAVCLCGCATSKVNWDDRVGAATFDDLVVEMGPPDKQAKLQDGTVVAEWITRRASHTTVVSGYYGVGGYYAPYAYVPAAPIYTDFYSPDFVIRLTFGPDGKLQSWKKVRR